MDEIEKIDIQNLLKKIFFKYSNKVLQFSIFRMIPI